MFRKEIHLRQCAVKVISPQLELYNRQENTYDDQALTIGFGKAIGIGAIGAIYLYSQVHSSGDLTLADDVVVVGSFLAAGSQILRAIYRELSGKNGYPDRSNTNFGSRQYPNYPLKNPRIHPKKLSTNIRRFLSY